MDILSPKKCYACGEWKNKNDFGKNKSKSDGLASECKVCARKRAKAVRDANPEKDRERCRQWRILNPGRLKEVFKKWYQNNKERAKEYERQARAKNLEGFLEKHRKASRKYMKSHPDKVREGNHVRRARIKKSGGRITSKEWQALKVFYNNTCLKCGRKEPEIKLELDHVIAISDGGANVITNAQCLCVHCNRSKGGNHIDYRPIIFYG